LRNKTKKKFSLLFLLFLLNVVSASLLHNPIYNLVEDFIYQEYDSYLLTAKEKMHETFKGAKAENWQVKAVELGNIYDTQCLIVANNSDNFSKDVLHLINSAQSTSGVVDLDGATVYYPLNDDFVAELGPIPFNYLLAFIYDWFTWAVAILLNLIFAYGYLTYSERKQQELTKEILSLPIPIKTNEQPLAILAQLRASLATVQQDNENRLILQRDLLHGVAHEFRSPMARIQFALDMLEDTPAAEHERLTKSMHNSLADLDELVKELLYYARLKDSHAAFKNEPIILQNICKESIEQVSAFYPKVEFSLIMPELVTLVGDEKHIKRMLVNLLRNAGRFAKHHCCLTVVKNVTGMTILVDDDGIGIPPGKAERIFEPFTRLDPSRSRDSGGCGLGLAIVASIVGKHQGTIRVVDSKLGGACFEAVFKQTNH
jgi:two-component system sensor histidine kinase RstB